MNYFTSPDAKITNSTCGKDSKIYCMTELRDSSVGAASTIGDQSILLNSHLDNNIAINRRNFIQDSEIGRYTYTGVSTQIRGVKIGQFCSISWLVSIGGKNHDYSRVTNSALWGFLNMDGRKPKTFNYKNGNDSCIIENDVWIGSNAVILRGVTIGNGAVIGAGAVITKDVEPYSIVVGVPAKPIKKRFDERTIEELQGLQWWNWPIEVIRENIGLIYSEKVNDSVISRLKEISREI